MTSASALTIKLAEIHLVTSADPDFNTARLRLPAALWAKAGTGYHRPVRVCLQTEHGEWLFLCISTYTESQTDGLHAAQLDARVVCPPSASLSTPKEGQHAASEASTQLPSVWAAAQAAGAEIRVLPVTGAIQNAASLQVLLHSGAGPLSFVRPRLQQTLLVPGAYVRLVTGACVHVEQVTAQTGGAEGSKRSAVQLYRVAPSTQLLLACSSDCQAAADSADEDGRSAFEDSSTPITPSTQRTQPKPPGKGKSVSKAGSTAGSGSSSTTRVLREAQASVPKQTSESKAGSRTSSASEKAKKKPATKKGESRSSGSDSDTGGISAGVSAFNLLQGLGDE